MRFRENLCPISFVVRKRESLLHVQQRLVFTNDGVGVVIRSIELYDLVKKTAFWCRLRLRRLQSSEN